MFDIRPRMINIVNRMKEVITHRRGKGKTLVTRKSGDGWRERKEGRRVGRKEKRKERKMEGRMEGRKEEGMKRERRD